MSFSLTATRSLARLRRSFTLLAAFPDEQKHPARFYGLLASDTAKLLHALSIDAGCGGLTGKAVLDVGGGPGYFAEEFHERGAHYVTVEPDVGEMAAADIEVSGSVRADGTALPFADDTFDIVYSSNVAEHVARPWDMAAEMLRVTAPGGLMVLSYTVWLGPFGGHETGLIPHYIGGDFARRRYEKHHGHPPKNVFGHSLFKVSCEEGLTWAKNHGDRADTVAVIPRYHPWWAWWLTRVPGVREFAVSNLLIALRKR